jgi:hypothetical protein
MANVQHSPLESHSVSPISNVQMVKRLNLATRAHSRKRKISVGPPWADDARHRNFHQPGGQSDARRAGVRPILQRSSKAWTWWTFYRGYGEMRPKGKNIDPGRVEEESNEYLVQRFPKLDYIEHATFVP